MDLQLIIVKLHQELGFIDRAIAELEHMSAPRRRRPFRRDRCNPPRRTIDRPRASTEERGSC